METQGILARVILHEYDHLEGILFIDRIPEQKKNRILSKIEKNRSKQENPEGVLAKDSPGKDSSGKEASG